MNGGGDIVGGSGGVARTLSPSAVARALGCNERTVQGWCAGHAGKTVWKEPCPFTRLSNGYTKLNLAEVQAWCRRNGLAYGDVKVGADGPPPARRLADPPAGSGGVARGETPDLFAMAGGAVTITPAEAARRFMAMFEELSMLHRQLMGSMKGAKGVHLSGENKERLAGALEGRGVEVSAERLAAAVEEAGLYLGPPVVVDVSPSALNQMMQAMGKAEAAARMQNEAHLAEQKRRDEVVDRASAERLMSQAGGLVRAQLGAAGSKAARAAMDAAASAGLVFAREVKGEKEGDTPVLTAVSESEVMRVLLVKLKAVIDGEVGEAAKAFAKAAAELERRAVFDGRAA